MLRDALAEKYADRIQIAVITVPAKKAVEESMTYFESKNDVIVFAETKVNRTPIRIPQKTIFAARDKIRIIMER